METGKELFESIMSSCPKKEGSEFVQEVNKEMFI